MSNILHGNRIFDGTITKSKLGEDVLADIAGGMTSAQVDAKLNELKVLLFGGEVPAALDTFRELAEALTTDRTGVAALAQVVSGKATPADIATAVSAMRDILLGGASEQGNTLRKLELLVTAAQQAAANAIADGAITNAKLAADIRVGSLNAAANAFPVGVQSGLTSVEKFLVYLSQQLSAVQASAGQQQSTGSNHEARLTAVEQALPGKASATDFNALSQRVSAAETTLGGKASSTDVSVLTSRVASLEARPTGTTGTQLTDGSITNAHLNQDIKAGSLESANTALNTNAVSSTGLIIQVHNKLKALIDNLTNQVSQAGSGLPSQAGQAGKFLKTDGTTASWASAGEVAPPPPVNQTTQAANATSIDFAFDFIDRAAGAGNITYQTLSNVTLGHEIRIATRSTNAGDALVIGAQTVDGLVSAFTTALNINGANANATFNDRGGLFIGGAANGNIIELKPTSTPSVANPTAPWVFDLVIEPRP